MTLPTYDKSKRRKSFEQLPKGAYVIRILAAKEEPNQKGVGSHLTVMFDIAEGEYAGFYQRQYDRNTNVDKKWPRDAIYYLAIPGENPPEYVVTNYNTFFADLEDSNNGYVFSGDPRSLNGKLLGGKFALEQSEYNGEIYDHIKLRWTCVAEDVRQGKAGKMPNDKLVKAQTGYNNPTPANHFVEVPEGINDELPFV